MATAPLLKGTDADWCVWAGAEGWRNRNIYEGFVVLSELWNPPWSSEAIMHRKSTSEWEMWMLKITKLIAHSFTQ